MKYKYLAAVISAAFLLSACSAVSEDIPDDSAVPAAVDVISQEESDIPLSETEAAISDAAVSVESVSESSAAESDTEPVTEVTSEQTSAEEISADISVTEIMLTFYSTSLNIGDTVMPIVSMLPESAPDKSEIWTSSDESIATVDGMGNITAVSAGECTVTVRSAACPDICAEVSVTVKAPVSQPTYIDGILIANKTYALPKDYNPGVDPEAQAAFDEMQAAAAAEGLNIYISSGFRSYDYQAGLYNRYVERSGKAEADRYSARPGHSEHQTGLAFDLNSIDISFADTDEYVWVKEHCAEYGFIIRYPEDGEKITGYMYEPWHIRYLGKDTAQKVSDSGLTLEEYLGIDSEYDE